ncbi:MAG: KpsF/GutQ family sugar-phosphate isomerase [Pirellulaceae bacterium]|nr:KpsF/GutQ family sugar-phosphate isomerase [Pirellulaceae bacterium]
MGMEAASQTPSLGGFEQLVLAREIITVEGRSVLSLADQIDSEFCRATSLIIQCNGCVIVSGMGKAGLIGQKIAATMASTGTRSQFLHPAEAVHGDLGRVDQTDIVLMLSQSGETEEITRLLPSLLDMQIPVVAITGHTQSTLARHAQVVLNLGNVQEAGDLALAPTTSTTMMLALGDALALVTSQMRQFRPEDFKRFHPGGSLGRRLTSVDDVMRPLHACRIAHQHKTVREVLVEAGRPGRRSGAILLINDQHMLTGMFTDSELARLLENQRDQELDLPIEQVMTRNPVSVVTGTRVQEAKEILARRKISELPVIDASGQPIGLIDITDVVGLSPLDTILHQESSKTPNRDDTQVSHSGAQEADNLDAHSLRVVR